MCKALKRLKNNHYNHNDFEIKDGVLIKYKGSEKNVMIPKCVTSIGDHAFAGCNTLMNIKIPDSVTNIGKFAFADCSELTSIRIPDSVTNLGIHAFDDCIKLEIATISNNVTELEGGLLWMW